MDAVTYNESALTKTFEEFESYCKDIGTLSQKYFAKACILCYNRAIISDIDAAYVV